ncbi:citrate synthase [Escherichia coli]|nr:citrate synthase [Escherichia coli]
MADTKAKLTLNGDTAVELDVLKGTLGQDVIDIRTLGSKGVFTFDPGFTSTASCESKITFIDGDEGICCTAVSRSISWRPILTTWKFVTSC